ncbi:MAG: MCE family protein [Candidatus Omnitrophica bacterium]|nr:MCE family protein [Candidatus Omnitrophota bacterium]
MPKEPSLEFKVGIFVIIGLIGLTFFIFSVTDTSLFSEGKNIKVVFGFANGLKKNAPVRVAGVDQGIVKDMILFYDRQDGRTKVQVTLWINKDAKIPADSRATINQLGLMGEKYIEIVPGFDQKQFMGEGQLFVGKDPISQEEISRKVLEVANKVDQTIGGFNLIVNDPKNKENLSNILNNFSVSSENFITTSAGIQEIVQELKDGKGTIGHLLADEAIFEDLKSLSADLKANPWKLLYRPKK